MLTKPQLRKKYRNILLDLSPEEIQTQSREICRLLQTDKLFLQSSSILFYAPTPLEPDINPLLTLSFSRNLKVFIPYVKELTLAQIGPGTELRLSGQGIYQAPADLKLTALPQLDLVLIPGLAFDRTGARLGHGGGWYDRFLELYRSVYPNSQIRLAGVCFREQLSESLPLEPWDLRCELIFFPR